MIPIPYLLTLQEWADCVIMTHNVPKLINDDWQYWGDEICFMYPQKKLRAPREFSTWQQWAESIVGDFR